jgi:heme-degrading monooxygenase HmoA
MIAVIFEAYPAPDYTDAYLDIAAALKPLLEQIDGFISVERFRSIADPAKVLSLSFFRDEKAVAQWRNLQAHRAAQARGKGVIFADYRLRVATVVRDYGRDQREQAPHDSIVAHGI